MTLHAASGCAIEESPYAAPTAKMNWSQQRLAEAAEMDRSYVAGIEVGARNPSLKAIERLARALCVGLADLFRE